MFWTCKAKIFRNPRQCNTLDSGQIIIFPPPRFPWNSRACPFQNATFWGGFRYNLTRLDGTLASKQGRPPETVRLMLPWLKDTPGKTDPGRKLPVFFGVRSFAVADDLCDQSSDFRIFVDKKYDTTTQHNKKTQRKKQTNKTNQTNKTKPQTKQSKQTNTQTLFGKKASQPQNNT